MSYFVTAATPFGDSKHIAVLPEETNVLAWLTGWLEDQQPGQFTVAEFKVSHFESPVVSVRTGFSLNTLVYTVTARYAYSVVQKAEEGAR